MFPAFSLDADLRYTDFNDVHAGVMRALYGAEIALGDLIEDHMTVSADRETALANLRRALTGERVVVSAFSGDGEARRYFDVTHAPVRDAGGAVVGVDVRAYDASDREFVERQLEDERLRYRELFRHLALAVAVHEIVFDDAGLPVDYVFVEGNPAFEALTGLVAADVVGRRATELLPDGLETGFVEACSQAVAGGEPVTFEHHVTPPDRDYRAIAYVVGEDRLVTTFEDVTEQRRTDQALAESEERYRMLAENATDAVFRSSNDGTVEWVSAPVAGIVGWSPEELQGRVFNDFVHPDDLDVLRESQDHVLRGGTARYEARVRCRARRLPVDLDHAAAHRRRGRRRGRPRRRLARHRE